MNAAGSAWALDPFDERVHFVEVHNPHLALHIPEPIRAPLNFGPWSGPATYEPRKTRIVWAKEYASPTLRWRGFMWVSPEDEGKLLAALQAAEGVTLFFAWLIR
jgi:hypothetical protein